MPDTVSNTGAASGLSWPNPANFAVALQSPSFAFRDAELKKCEIKKDDHGLPRPWAGAFANVYQATLPNGVKRAIRVFICAVPERRDRYQELVKYFQNRRLNSLVQFSYDDRGIRSGGDGKWYPLITMEWVAGETLYDWVKIQCLQRNGQALTRVCNLWTETVTELATAKIAHGDLQHGNIMVAENGKLSLKLVDYDCMCVPSLVGRKNLELGVDPYQHPQRNADTRLSPSLDNFSALFIFTALRALAASPDLWKAHIERPPPYDKLLFRREDLDSPRNSSLIADLKRSPDEEVRRLSQELVDMTRAPIDQVPPLEMTLFSWAKVRSLLSQRDFDLAIELVTRSRKKFGEAPPPLPTDLQVAQQRIQQRLALEQAVQAGDEAAMQRLYQPKLLDDYPKAHACVTTAKDAAQVLRLLQQLQSASGAKSWRPFVQIWDAHQTLLANRPSAQGFVAAVNAWRQRNQACDVLLGLMKQPCPNPAALEAAWSSLDKLGGHPEAEPHRARFQQMLARQQAWAEFSHVPQELSEQVDSRLVATWKEPLFAGWDEAECQRPRVEQARRRLALLQKLPGELAKPASAAVEQAIEQIVQGLPTGYVYQLQARIEQSLSQSRAMKQLLHAMDSSASDLAIVKAWQSLVQAGGQALLPKSHHARIVLAKKRVHILLALKKIPANYPLGQAAEHDPHILELWNEELLRECHDTAPWQAAYEAAVQHRNSLTQLGEAIRTKDGPKIADLAGALSGYSLPGNWGDIVRQAKADVEAVQSLLKVLQGGHRSRFFEVFDARSIRPNAKALARYEAQIRQWLPTEILPAAKLGLGMPIGRKALVKDPDSNTAYQVCWNWPASRFSEECMLVLCRSRPGAEDDPRKMTVQVRLLIDRKRYEEACGMVPLNVIPEWQRCYVVVWALVDLGFEEFLSEPVVLGRVESS